MSDLVLRWVAIGLLALITFIFFILGTAIISGLTSDLFHGYLQLTWPDARSPTSSAFPPEAREEISFSILNYGITAMGTAWVASFAYLIVMRNQQKQAEQQLSIERMKLTTDLDAQILEIFDMRAVFDTATNGAQLRIPLISVLDRNTEWRASTDRNWTYQGGERTIAFVESSSVVSPKAEVSVSVLHHYLAWIRRIARATETGVLMEKDVLLFWRWVVVGCYRHRFTFLRDIFQKDDLEDFVRLAGQIVITGDRLKSGRDFTRYLRALGDAELISLLPAEAQTIIASEPAA